VSPSEICAARQLVPVSASCARLTRLHVHVASHDVHRVSECAQVLLRTLTAHIARAENMLHLTRYLQRDRGTKTTKTSDTRDQSDRLMLLLVHIFLVPSPRVPSHAMV
jgi:hypothetical protein